MAGHEREHLEWLSPKNDVAKAIHYMLRADPMAFVHPLPRRSSDGRFCLSNNAAEHALRCVAVGRRNWTFAGSDAGGAVALQPSIH
jgi:transposase